MTEEWLLWIALGFAAVCCGGMYFVTRKSKPKIGAYFTTPPDISRCVRLRTDGPTPCLHPHCDCMTDIYTAAADEVRKKMRDRFEAPRPRLGADEGLRRHIHATRKETTRVTPRTEA